MPTQPPDAQQLRETVTLVISVLALAVGVAGLVLSVLNYLRDRRKVIVTLQWDLDVTPGTEYDVAKKWGVIQVTNVGRRPTYFSHVALKLPSGYGDNYLLIKAGIQGKTLSEGDPAALFVVSQDGMETYARDWRRIVAQVTDSTGTVWSSARPRKAERPSWAAPSA